MSAGGPSGLEHRRRLWPSDIDHNIRGVRILSLVMV